MTAINTAIDKGDVVAENNQHIYEPGQRLFRGDRHKKIDLQQMNFTCNLHKKEINYQGKRI
jgi:hypothetical protein